MALGKELKLLHKMAKILRNFYLLLLTHLCERLMYKFFDTELVSQKYLHTKSFSKKFSNLNLTGKLQETFKELQKKLCSTSHSALLPEVTSSTGVNKFMHLHLSNFRADYPIFT